MGSVVVKLDGPLPADVAYLLWLMGGNYRPTQAERDRAWAWMQASDAFGEAVERQAPKGAEGGE